MGLGRAYLFAYALFPYWLMSYVGLGCIFFRGAFFFRPKQIYRYGVLTPFKGLHPWAAWFCLCLRVCVPPWVLWALVPHLSPTLGAPGRMLFHLSPIFLLSPSLGALGRVILYVSHLSPTLGCHSECSGPHDFTLVSHLSPTLGCHSECSGPHDFTLVSHLFSTLGALGRMILHLSPTLGALGCMLLRLPPICLPHNVNFTLLAASFNGCKFPELTLHAKYVAIRFVPASVSRCSIGLFYICLEPRLVYIFLGGFLFLKNYTIICNISFKDTVYMTGDLPKGMPHP